MGLPCILRDLNKLNEVEIGITNLNTCTNKNMADVTLHSSTIAKLIESVNDNAAKLTQKADTKNLTSPFIFKGNCLFADLPLNNNNINDTYFVNDENCNYTWNGTEWHQSSSKVVSSTLLTADDADNFYNGL